MLTLQSLKYQSIVFTDRIKHGSLFGVSLLYSRCFLYGSTRRIKNYSPFFWVKYRDVLYLDKSFMDRGLSRSTCVSMYFQMALVLKLEVIKI